MNRLLSFLTVFLILVSLSCSSNENNEDQKTDNQTMNRDKNSDVDNDNDQDKDEKKNDENKDEDDNDFMKGMKNFTDMMKKNNKVKAVDFRKLKDLLPEELDGMKRTGAKGEKTNSMGVNVSQSEGEYKSDDGKQNIKITIIDFGSMKGFTSMALFAWTMADIDKETDDGYEKTTKFKGYKAFEKYNAINNSGDLEVLVGDRFMVKGEGRGVDMDTIHDAVGEVDLSTLESMKDEGKDNS